MKLGNNEGDNQQMIKKKAQQYTVYYYNCVRGQEKVWKVLH